jgi:hypothetical protein
LNKSFKSGIQPGSRFGLTHVLQQQGKRFKGANSIGPGLPSAEEFR